MASSNQKVEFPFTVSRVNSLPIPDSDRVYYRDSSTPGLTVCVTAAGSRTYYLYRKIGGRPCRIRIGRTDEIPLAHARERAQQLVGDIAHGKDPHAERIARRGEMTLGQLFDHYLEHYAKPYKRTWKGDQWQFNKYLAHWKNRQLSSIRKVDVQALHAKLGRDHGTYSANRVLALLRGLFNKATNELGFAKPNPAVGIKKFAEQSRERFLAADELPKFFRALDDEPNETIRDFFVVSLLTGGRRGNVQSMLWEELNLERGTWVIPGEKFKNGQCMTVVLPPQVVEILERRYDNRNGSAYVFPARRGGKHLISPKKAWANLLARAGIGDLRMHDLRRSLGSWQAINGASLPVIGKSLGHRNQATTAIYARLDLDPVRESVNRAVAAMMMAAKPATQKELANGRKKTAR